MKQLLIGLVLLVIIYCGYKFLLKNNGVVNGGPKQEALKIGTHSTAFNNSIDTMLVSYFNLADAFVNADSTRAKTAGQELAKSFDNIPLSELKNDTASKKDALLIFSADSSSLVDAKSFVDSLTNESNLAKMRQDFGTINQDLYPFLKGINYSGKNKIIYWYNCPMAFGEDNSANWLSSTEEKFNPYLGLHHPEYKGAMVHCGELQDSIMSK